MPSNFTGSPPVEKSVFPGLALFNPISSVEIFQYNLGQVSRLLAPNYSAAGGGKDFEKWNFKAVSSEKLQIEGDDRTFFLMPIQTHSIIRTEWGRL